MSKTINEIAEIAAEWWSDKIATPKYDNGDKSATGFYTMAMASLLKENINNEAKEKFQKTLFTSIIQNFEKTDTFILSVDYSPDRVLRDAAKEAGVSDNNFPWKTVMWIDKNYISVRYGYGADMNYLYANKKYWEDKIESIKDTMSEYEFGDILSWIDDEEEKEAHKREVLEELNDDLILYKRNLDNAEY